MYAADPPATRRRRREVRLVQRTGRAAFTSSRWRWPLRRLAGSESALAPTNCRGHRWEGLAPGQVLAAPGTASLKTGSRAPSAGRGQGWAPSQTKLWPPTRSSGVAAPPSTGSALRAGGGVGRRKLQTLQGCKLAAPCHAPALPTRRPSPRRLGAAKDWRVQDGHRQSAGQEGSYHRAHCHPGPSPTQPATPRPRLRSPHPGVT